MATIQDITDAVAAETAVEQSIIVLLAQLAMELQAAIAAEDSEAMQAVVDTLTTNSKAMADAIVANTPAAPVAAPGPHGDKA